jgi:hypothetical protein
MGRSYSAHGDDEKCEGLQNISQKIRREETTCGTMKRMGRYFLMNRKETQSENVIRIQLALGTVQWLTFVDKAMNIPVT